jgi:curli biogenesis system outer membrane secretion channel CsgG
VNKDQLSDAVRLLKKGSSIEDLRKSRFWDDMVGVQYLLRLDVNSFEMNVTEDSVYDEKNKFVRVDRHSVASANLTARLVDVATSKVLMFNNFDVNGSTKGYAEYKTQTDSARALIQLNKQVRGAANGMIHGTVAGAALLTSIHQEKPKRSS